MGFWRGEDFGRVVVTCVFVDGGCCLAEHSDVICQLAKCIICNFFPSKFFPFGFSNFHLPQELINNMFFQWTIMQLGTLKLGMIHSTNQTLKHLKIILQVSRLIS